MYEGKRTNPKSAKGMKRKFALMVSLLLALTVGIGATVAYLIDNTEDVQNVFIPAEIPPEITETFNGTLKTNVKVTNSGNTDAYIRAVVVASWQETDENGNLTGVISPEIPVLGTDYTITYDLANGWSEASDGFYYWKEPVKSVEQDPDNCSTDILIASAEQLIPNNGYRLVIEIMAQTIQSIPTSVVTEVWKSGVSGVNGTTLQIK